MQLQQIEVKCQAPPNSQFVSRKYTIVQCSISKDSKEYETLLSRARKLSEMVNPAAANAAFRDRKGSRLLMDAFGGVLAEAGWLQYINSVFGEIARPTPFTSAMLQIDICFTNGEIAEVRSSFPRNGVKFALCSNAYNFKNLGPYTNSVKPGEIQKHLYLGVLFDTQKDALLSDRQVMFSLVGGSTWKMMVDHGHNVSLEPQDGITRFKSSYKVIEFKNALDALGVIAAIEALGYTRKK